MTLRSLGSPDDGLVAGISQGIREAIMDREIDLQNPRPDSDKGGTFHYFARGNWWPTRGGIPFWSWALHGFDMLGSYAE